MYPFALRAAALCASTLLSAAVAADVASALKPPAPAPVKPVTETLWGRRVTDDYRYMETLDPATMNWMKAQGAYARAQLDECFQRCWRRFEAASPSHALVIAWIVEDGLSHEQIGELLEQAEAVSDGPTRVAYLEEAVRLADLHADEQLGRLLGFLADTGYSAAPVIDESGRPIGVVSRTDVVVYDRARIASATDVPPWYDHADLDEWANPASRAPSGPGAVVRAADLMTPAVFSVGPETPAERVAAQMAALNVHRLFVVDDDGVLVGVISALDLLRYFSGTA